jgi:hypothetical protein
MHKLTSYIRKLKAFWLAVTPFSCVWVDNEPRQARLLAGHTISDRRSWVGLWMAMHDRNDLAFVLHLVPAIEHKMLVRCIGDVLTPEVTPAAFHYSNQATTFNR